MFKYTSNVINNSLDIIKKMIYIFQVLIQVTYISFLVYKTIFDNNNQLVNIVLLILSFVYLIIFIMTSNEFYTNKDKYKRKVLKYIFKITKYVINLYLIIITIKSLINNQGSEPLNTIFLLLMIIGLLVNIVFDIILEIINKQVTIINNAIKYDVDKFTEDRSVITALLNQFLKIDLKSFPKITNTSEIDELEYIKASQEKKQERKKDFIFNKRQKTRKKQ